MLIKIIGSGCMNCKKLYEAASQAAMELGVPAELVKVEDLKEIMRYGIMRTPGLVINEKVKVYGKVPGVEEIKKYIQEEME